MAGADDANKGGNPPNAGDQDGKLPVHPLVRAVVKDPDKIPKTVRMVGYLGASGRDGYVRIYLDLEFRTYYELPRNSVLYAPEADPDRIEDPTTIFVDADATLTLVQTLEASLLAGPIASDLSQCCQWVCVLPPKCTLPGPLKRITYGCGDYRITTVPPPPTSTQQGPPVYGGAVGSRCPVWITTVPPPTSTQQGPPVHGGASGAPEAGGGTNPYPHPTPKKIMYKDTGEGTPNQ